jgi:plastocyanin
MSVTTKLAATFAALAALSFGAVGLVAHDEARATPAVAVDDANPTITITNEGTNYTFVPAELQAKAGQAITVVNKDANAVHSVTAKDKSFSVDVAPQSTVTFKVTKAGSYPYYCQYHVDTHNPATLTIS